MRISLLRIGNSHGVIIPKPLLAQLDLSGDIDQSGALDLTVEAGAIVLRKAKRGVREGWAEDAQAIAAAGDDELVWPEFGNAGDSDLTW